MIRRIFRRSRAEASPDASASVSASADAQLRKGRSTGMTPSIIILSCLCIILIGFLFRRSPAQLSVGLHAAWTQFIQAFPIVVLTFLLLGLLAVIVPREVYAHWLSEKAGWRGILAGTVAGAVAPGGPVIQAIIASMALRFGAGVGCIVAFLTAGALAHVLLLPLELGLMGWRFVAARLACTIFFPPIAGMLAHLLFRGFVR
jgi:uncharacterized membrane protein YraQ (UPF0718 family)